MTLTKKDGQSRESYHQSKGRKCKSISIGSAIRAFVILKAAPKKNLRQKTSFLFFFTKWHFEKFINRMSGGYEMILKLSYQN